VRYAPGASAKRLPDRGHETPFLLDTCRTPLAPSVSSTRFIGVPPRGFEPCYRREERRARARPSHSESGPIAFGTTKRNATPRAVSASPPMAGCAPHVLGRSPAPEVQYNLQPPALTHDARARCDSCGASLPRSSRRASADCSRSSWPRTLRTQFRPHDYERIQAGRRLNAAGRRRTAGITIRSREEPLTLTPLAESECYPFSAASFSCIAEGMNRRYAFSIIAILVPV
jgi:hypothetical protein